MNLYLAKFIHSIARIMCTVVGHSFIRTTEGNEDTKQWQPLLICTRCTKFIEYGWREWSTETEPLDYIDYKE